MIFSSAKFSPIVSKERIDLKSPIIEGVLTKKLPRL